MTASDRDNVRNILLIRTDRIGDVVLSLPMLPVMKKHFPNASVTVLVQKYTRELVEFHSCVDRVIEWVPDGSRSMFEYVKTLRAGKFDIALLPYPRFNLALITFMAGIPVRVGTGYRWYSFLFNRKVYEHRKDARRHETEYNLNLLTALDIPSEGKPAFELVIPGAARQRVDALLSNSVPGPFVVLHAGSGGSARDWPPEKFAQLGDAIHASLKCSIVLTGGKHEEALTGTIARLMKAPAVNVTGMLSLLELGALFSRANVFIANSTGPLHIASAVGTPVVGFYPPIVQCSAVRWGPYTEKKKVFTADHQRCPLCEGGPCQSNVCMEQITIDAVLEGVKELYETKK